MPEGLKRVVDKAERDLAERMQEMHERGEMRHLYGKRLAIEEEDLDRLVARMLKQEGFSHPALERRQEVEAELAAADSIIERLRQRRASLLERCSDTPVEAAHGFNDGRRFTLEEYRGRLAAVNRSIRDYNLTVPDALQVRPVMIDRHMERIERSVPPVDTDLFRTEPTKRGLWVRVRRGQAG